MKELTGNMLETDCDAICITTNGFVKRNGECVMGKGIAKQIKQYFPDIAYDLGQLIKTNGNKVNLIYPSEPDVPAILSYPVKPVRKVCTSHDDYVSHMRFNIGDMIPGWACKADPKIIIQSAYQLVELANRHDWKTILIPRVGCGAGELDWEDIKPLIEPILDDRFIAMTFK